MKDIIGSALHQIKDNSTIQRIDAVQGGSINESFYVETKKRNYFIKCHAYAPNHFFELEAKGLQLIRETNTISVPEVLVHSDLPGRSFLIMEWIEGESKYDSEIKLGNQLSEMHQNLGEQHGFMYDTFIGLLPQPNGLFTNWLEYYRDQRLFVQLDYAIENNRVCSGRRKQMESLLSRLDEWVPVNVDPAHLHGDLWSGNWLVGQGGDPYIVDPSFLYGDRHFELAFTELFGGFSSKFYETYKGNYPLSSNYEDVKPIYQLYYLLVHLNIFGESYGARIDRILNRYICG